MAHNIRRDAQGRAFMASIYPTWHGLENLVERGTPLANWVEICDMDSEVLKIPAGYNVDGVWYTPENHYALVDSKRRGLVPYMNVTDRYQVHQRIEIVRFFEEILNQHNLQICTMGQLQDGALIWVQGESDKPLHIKGERVDKRFMAFTSYNGITGTGGKFTAVCVVCNNTFNAAMNGKGKQASIRHSRKRNEDGSIDFDPILKALGMLPETADKLEHDFNKLAERPVTQAEIDALFLSWFGKAKDSEKPVSLDNLTKQSRNVIETVKVGLGTAPGATLDSRRGTAFGVFNAVTYYVDHAAKAHEYQNKQYNAMFGKGQTLKEQAFSDLLTLAIDKTLSPTLESVLEATVAG